MAAGVAGAAGAAAAGVVVAGVVAAGAVVVFDDVPGRVNLNVGVVPDVVDDDAAPVEVGRFNLNVDVEGAVVVVDSAGLFNPPRLSWNFGGSPDFADEVDEVVGKFNLKPPVDPSDFVAVELPRDGNLNPPPLPEEELLLPRVGNLNPVPLDPLPPPPSDGSLNPPPLDPLSPPRDGSLKPPPDPPRSPPRERRLPESSESFFLLDFSVLVLGTCFESDDTTTGAVTRTIRSRVVVCLFADCVSFWKRGCVVAFVESSVSPVAVSDR